jgi:LmbE family N-acetylglucosaminyl deacetylase
VPTDPVPPPTGRPIVFYSPHQDDETLFMGQVIAHHALAGREVHVVLCTSGETPIVIEEINGVRATANPWWGGFHFPAREGYAPITKEQLGRARDAEFIAACGQLGVYPQNIHVGQNLPDGMTVAQAEALMRSYADRFAAEGEPVVGHYTMWWGDDNATHAAIGQALRNLRTQQPQRFSDARWFTKPEHAATAGAIGYTPPAALRPEILRMTRRATYPYRSWAPRQGMYAVGYHSVGNWYFDEVERGDENHVVVP